ncbi:HAMP domain-containing sensor histidine kinase [Exiguobacterium sp. 17-1]|uniref:HAMP domain-containing sensor histidine kinase n=1 Tax=Exiguobacterium sp. 17-1 TaxID=2931981 RepID=UPI001FFF375A|nr:HAMP domain-containing sensor histidine kinase [Exiguobacterium sp. 17-1]MCK2156341.1 HAMP domain-containing histidine kinase [Exiguobacterium sp. 17-1]
MSKLMRKFLLAVIAPLLIMGVLSFSLTAFLVNRFAEDERYSQLTREANIIQEALTEDRPVPREIQGFITRDGVTERIGGRGRQVVELPILNDLQQQDSIEVQGNRLLTYQLTSGNTVITTIREAPLASSALDGVYLAIGVALLAALLLATGLAYYMGRQFIRPIMELRTVAKQIGDGRKDVALPIRPNDEVGDLIHAVDEMQEQLVQKEALQKSFIAGITHDLRTPIAIIRNETEALAAGVIPVDELPDVTSSIIEETDRLGLLIDETLVYSKLAGGMMPLDRTEVVLNQLVEETVERLRSTFLKDGLRLTVETVPVRLSFDRRMFERVLVNFLMNAHVAAPSGSEVLVRLTESELTVEDAGSGVAESDRATIWDLYVKQTGGSGHGLGLAISRLILDSHGLAYGVRNSALGGACFYIRFK